MTRNYLQQHRGQWIKLRLTKEIGSLGSIPPPPWVHGDPWLLAPSLSLSLVAKSCPTLVTPWTIAHQAPLSMGFSRQEYWSGLPFPSPGDLPDTGIEPWSPALQALFTVWATRGSLRIAVSQNSISLHLIQKSHNNSGLNNSELYFPW